MFNITYYPTFSKLKNILFKIHLLLTPDRKHRKVFENVPLIGFKKGKSLKNILVRTKVPPLKTEKGFCGPCDKPRCQICKHVTKTHQFESSSTKRIYSIRPQNLNCASKNVVYLFTCKTCHKQYTGSTEEFRHTKVDLIIIDVRIWTFWEIKKLNKSHFTLISRKCVDVRRRESYWQHELDTFQPNGLNERGVALF